MATTHKWNALTGASTMASTELNSLASGSYALGAAYDNSTNLYQWMWLELDVTFGTGPTVNTPIDVYIIESVDGTNYEYSTTPKATRYRGSFLVVNSTSAQKHIIGPIPILPMKFKIDVYNGTNQSFPASGTTVKGYFAYEQDA